MKNYRVEAKFERINPTSKEKEVSERMHEGFFKTVPHAFHHMIKILGRYEKVVRMISVSVKEVK